MRYTNPRLYLLYFYLLTYLLTYYILTYFFLSFFLSFFLYAGSVSDRAEFGIDPLRRVDEGERRRLEATATGLSL